MVAGALRTWADRGWLRKLDAALAGFVADTCPAADGATLLATALTAHLEGRGHACLLLPELLDDPERLLAWPPDAMDALQYVLSRLPSGESAWTIALRGSGAVFVAGEGPGDDGDGQPLVLAHRRLYLRRYWGYERRIARRVLERSAARLPVDDALARPLVERYFAARPDTQPSVPDWQKVAAALALRGRIAIVSGGPGTGKTHTAARVLALFRALAPDPAQFRIALAAPTGKAAARLTQSIESALVDLQTSDGSTKPASASRIGVARTLHSLLGTRRGSRHFRHDAANPLAVDLLIVDEASMVHVEMMDALLDALPATARLLLLGDKDQLASVEAGAVLGELCLGAGTGRYTQETASYVQAVAAQSIPHDERDSSGPPLMQQIVMLRRSERFGGTIASLARAVNAGNVEEAAAVLSRERGGPLAWSIAPTSSVAVDLACDGRKGAAGFGDYLDALGRRPDSLFAEDHDAWVGEVLEAFDRFRVLCAVRDGEWGVVDLNRAIERRLFDAGRLSGSGAWYAGRPVIVLRNDYDVGVFNGDIGIALPSSSRDSRLRVHFGDRPANRSVSVARLADVETAFAMTVHKAQGSEFAHTALVLPPSTSRVATRELLYTGITRARTALTLVSSRREALHEAIAQTTRRSSGIAAMIAAGDGQSDHPSDSRPSNGSMG